MSSKMKPSNFHIKKKKKYTKCSRKENAHDSRTCHGEWQNVMPDVISVVYLGVIIKNLVFLSLKAQ